MTNSCKTAAFKSMRQDGYTVREINFGLDQLNNTLSATKENVALLVHHAKYGIHLARDQGYIGTVAYGGHAYFWAYKNRYFMRGDALANNDHKRLNLFEVRRQIHDRMVAAGIALNGETPAHDEIINNAFGGDFYQAEEMVSELGDSIGRLAFVQ